MAVFLLKLVFFAVYTLSNIVLRLTFTTTASLLVLFVQAFKVPGEAAHGVLKQIAEAIKACFQYILELIMEAISSLISSALDILIEAITDSAAVTGSAIGGLVEKARTSLDGLLKEYLPQLADVFSDMVSNMITDLLNNYKDAVGYVTENV